MIITQYYPVKALTRELDIPTNKKISLFLDAESCWLSIRDDTTLVPDTTSPAIILDKIIGIKKPFLVTAADYADITSLSVTQNGTYTAPSGTAYSPVVVDVQEQPWAPLQDGYSNFWFELTDDTLSPWLNFSKKNADAVIDWGDGSGEQALDTLTPTHTYSKAGRYVIKVKGVTGIAAQGYVPYTAYSDVLKAVEFNSDVTAIDTTAFNRTMKLENVAFSNTITTMGSIPFGYCASLNGKIVLPPLDTIPSNCFTTCLQLKEIEVAEGTTTIMNNAFYYNVTLGKAKLPSTLTSIGNVAFAYCLGMQEIHIVATTPPTLGTNVFFSLPTSFIIYVPVGTGETYKAASGWSAYSDHILEEGQTPNRAMMSRRAKADGDIMEKLDDIEREEER